MYAGEAQHTTNTGPKFPKILMLDRAGTPVEWTTFDKYARRFSKNKVLWEIGENFDIRGGTNAKSGERTVLSVASIFAFDGMREKRFYDNISEVALSKDNDDLFARDNYTCGYCGGVFRHKQLSRDHIQPTSKGGKDIWMNVITACMTCNHAKADMTLSQWGRELLFLPYAPSQSEQLILSNRSIQPVQKEYLINTLLPDSKLLN